MSETEQTPENEIQLSPGSLLKQARERADISIEEVSGQLKLTVQTIISIESDNYSSDLPVTFYRGYLRNYAELLGVDDDDIVENFDNFCKRNNVFTKTEQSLTTFELEQPLTSSNWMIRVVTALIVLVLIFGAYYLLAEKKIWQQLTSAVTPSSGQETILPLGQSEDDSLLVPEQGNALLADSAYPQDQAVPALEDNELSSESLLIEEPEATTLTEEPISNSATASGELVLVFSDDCWVRITDASGKVLALGIKKGGTSMSLSGPTPIELTLGKPSAVQLSYQNEPIDLSSYPDTRAARLTLGD